MNKTAKWTAIGAPEMILPYIRTQVELELDKEKYDDYIIEYVPIIKFNVIEITSDTKFTTYLKDNGYGCSLFRRQPVIRFADIVKDTNYSDWPLDFIQQEMLLEFTLKLLRQFNIEGRLLKSFRK